MAESQRVIRALEDRYEVFIATAAMEVPTSFEQKFRWLGQHFPFIPSSHIVYCGDKGILRADYLIDDNPRQLRRIRRGGAFFNTPHKARVTGIRRVGEWVVVEGRCVVRWTSAAHRFQTMYSSTVVK